MERSVFAIKMKIEKEIREELKFCKEKHTELWLFMKKFEETENLMRELNETRGKISALEWILEEEKNKNGK